MLNAENGTKQVVDNLQEGLTHISQALRDLEKINNGEYKEGQDKIQFDFCTSPELAEKVNHLESVIKEISDITYQKKRRSKR
jgi:hypothetical protein